MRLYENGATLVRMSINQPKPSDLDPLAKAREHAKLASELTAAADMVPTPDGGRVLYAAAQAHALAALALTQLNPPARRRPAGAPQTRTAYRGGHQ